MCKSEVIYLSTAHGAKRCQQGTTRSIRQRDIKTNHFAINVNRFIILSDFCEVRRQDCEGPDVRFNHTVQHLPVQFHRQAWSGLMKCRRYNTVERWRMKDQIVLLHPWVAILG
jgi:hypothetical protein